MLRVSLFILADFIFLLIYSTELSISYREAKIYYNDISSVSFFAHLGVNLFGGAIGLRFFFILVHTLNSILIYSISKFTLKKDSDRFLALLLYTLLPGVSSSALILSETNFILFFLLSFIYLYLSKKSILSYLILISTPIYNKIFIILYIALTFESRDKFMKLLALILLFTTIYFIDFSSFGRPKSYFLDIFGIYMSIFSPFLFLYFIYSIYRILIKEEFKDIIFYISSIALISSLILSFRQKVDIVEFAPFLVIAIPLMVRVFFTSYRVRLYQFRQRYRNMFGFVIITLVFSFVITFFNKPLYLFTDRHFGDKFLIAKELSIILKDLNKTKLNIIDDKLRIRLKFYGIEHNENAQKLSKEPRGERIDIEYLNINVAKFYINDY